MLSADKDFQLTHEQLIKAVKIILYKVNLTTQKHNLKYEQSVSEIDDKLKVSEEHVKSNIDEAKHFLHTVHTDFEQFQLKHKQEHLDII